MKKTLAILSLLLSLAGSAFADKQVIAVWDVTSACGGRYGQRVAEDFKAQLTTALVNSGAFTVVERDQLVAVAREQGFQRSGLVDAATAVQVGKMNGAGLTFIGNVVAATAGHQDNVLYKTIKAKVKLNYKIIDNKTGVIKVSEMVEGNTSVLESHRPNPDLLIVNATKEAVEKVTDVLVKMNPLTGSVIKVSGDKAYINIGAVQGARVGDVYYAYKEGDLLVDPVTQDILGVEESEVAVLKVKTVQPSYCVAEIKKLNGKLTAQCKVRKGSKK